MYITFLDTYKLYLWGYLSIIQRMSLSYASHKQLIIIFSPSYMSLGGRGANELALALYGRENSINPLSYGSKVTVARVGFVHLSETISIQNA